MRRLTIKQLRKIIKEAVAQDEEVAQAEYEEMKSCQKSANIAVIFDNAVEVEAIQALKESEPSASSFMSAVMKLHSKSIKDGTATSTQFKGYQGLEGFFFSEKDAFEIMDEADRYMTLSKNFKSKNVNTQTDNVYGNTITGVFHVPTGVQVDTKKSLRPGGLGT